MRKCTLTESNCEGKDHRASASRVHVNQIPQFSQWPIDVKPLTMPTAC